LERKWTEKGSWLDTWIDRDLIRVPLGTSALKKGAVLVVEDETPEEKRKNKPEQQEGR
jgi:hypothetical protein